MQGKCNFTRHVDLLIRGGEVCSPPLRGHYDLGIRGGRVALLAEPGTAPPAREELDASGCLVLPGGVDPHVHFALEFQGHRLQHDYLSGTRAAAFGGTTTVADFAFPVPGGTVLDAVAERQRLAKGQAVVDYTYHPVLTDASPQTLEALPQLVEMGLPTFKVFLVYREAGLYVDDGALAAIMERLAGLPGRLLVHAESEGIVSRATAALQAAGRTQPRFYPQSRPVLAEAEAVSRTLFLARQLGTPLYFVHVTSRAALDLIAEARADGQEVIGETCPHYLLLDESRYEGPHGERFIMSPPLRTPSDQEALWAALADDRLSTVGSDDTAWSAEGKLAGREDFTLAPPGVPGIETRLPLLYSEGVATGRLSLERFVELTAANPARALGLYPQKGALQVGSDADVLVLDPRAEAEVLPERLHMMVDYSPYEGMGLRGRVREVLCRGSYALRDGELVGQAGHGLALRRHATPKPPPGDQGPKV